MMHMDYLVVGVYVCGGAFCLSVDNLELSTEGVNLSLSDMSIVNFHSSRVLI